MDQFEYVFRTFSSLGSMSVYDSYTFSSIFPYVQSQFLHPNSSFPEDVPLWGTAIPIACTIGKPKGKELDIVQATVYLICFRCCNFVSNFLQNNLSGKISAEDLELIQKIFNVVLEVFKLYKTQLGAISEKSAKVVHFLKKLKADCHDEKSLSQLIIVSNRTVKAIYAECESNLKLMPFYPYIRSLHESLLSFQIVGILFSASGMDETFELASDSVVSMSQNLLSSKKAETLQSLKDIQNSFSSASDSFQYTNLRSAAMTDFLNQIKALEDEILNGDLSPKNFIFINSYTNNSYEVYIPSFLHILSNIDLSNPDYDLFCQLAASLNSNTDDPEIQSVCAKICSDPQNSISYLALLSILLPLPTTSRISYLTSLAPSLSYLAISYLSLPPESTIKDAYEKLFSQDDLKFTRRICYAWSACLSDLLKMNMSILVQLSSLSLPFQSVESLSALINSQDNVLDLVTNLAEEMAKQIDSVISRAPLTLDNQLPVIKKLLDMSVTVKELFDMIKDLRLLKSPNGKNVILRSLAEAAVELDPLERKIILSLIQFSPCFGIPRLPVDNFEEARQIFEKFLMEDSFDYRNQDQLSLFLPKLGNIGQELYSLLCARIGNEDSMVTPMRDLFFAVLKEHNFQGLSDEDLFSDKISVVGQLIREGVNTDVLVEQLFLALVSSTTSEFMSHVKESKEIIEAGRILSDVKEISYELMHEKEENTERIAKYSDKPIVFSSEPSLRLKSVYDCVSLLAYAMSFIPSSLTKNSDIQLVRSVGKATISGCFSLDVIEGKPMLDYPKIGQMSAPWASAVIILAQEFIDLHYLKHLLNVPEVTFTEYVNAELKTEEVAVDYDLVLAQINESIRITDKSMRKLANHVGDMNLTRVNFEKFVISAKDLSDALKLSGMENYQGFAMVVDKSVDALGMKLQDYMDGRNTFEGDLSDYVHIFRKLRMDITGCAATSSAFDDLKLFSSRAFEILKATDTSATNMVSSATSDILKVILRFITDAIEQVSHILSSQGIVLKEKGIRKAAERVFDSLQLFYLLSRTEQVDIDKISAASKRLKASMSDALAQLSMAGESEDIKNKLGLQFSQLVERLSVLSQEISSNYTTTQAQKAEAEDISVSTEDSMNKLMRRLEIEAEILRCKANLEEAETYLQSLDEKGKNN